jgi:uncharacterized membrane protein
VPIKYHPAIMRPRRTFWDNFKLFFLRGLAVLLPSVLTIWIVVQLFLFVDAQVARPINGFLRSGLIYVVPQFPARIQPQWFTVTDSELAEYRAALASQASADARALAKGADSDLKDRLRREALTKAWDDRWYLRLIGLVVAVILFYMAGLLFGGLAGRVVYEWGERLLLRVPIIRQVYPHVKQVVDLVLGSKTVAFRKVVLVEYPRNGVYTVAFVTGQGMSSIADTAGSEMLTVFVPSTPTPFTGFTITVRKSEAIELPITVDEAVRFLLTGGVLIPEHQARAAAAGLPDPPLVPAATVIPVQPRVP